MKTILSRPAFVSIIAKEVMKYKQQIKENELITKIRIIRSVKKDHIPVVQVAQAFSCHRNTIANIISIFEKTVAQKDQQRLLVSQTSLSQEELNALYTANVRSLSPRQLRGIYKRNALTTEKVRSCTGEIRHLYDYQTLGCFERLHFDVKYVLDKHSLPENIYKALSGRQIPRYEWNQILSVMDARIYSYEPRFDIRKNLIERSHLTDDEELYISRGMYMGTKALFLKEVGDYQYYWNFQRSHTGIGMDNRTPFEMLKQSGLVGIEKLLNFPVLFLEDVIDALRRCNTPVMFESFAKEHPSVIQKSLTCQKTQRDVENRFCLPDNAQKVLTYYLK